MHIERKQEMCTELQWKASRDERNSEGVWSSNTTQLLLEERIEPSPVVARSKTWACGRSLAGIASSNPTGGMDVSLL